MKNHSLKALSLAAATLLLQSQAGAAPTSAELNSVKLYGDVTIAQDSVSGWGPWTEFEPPAAGNPPLAQLPGTSELYRTLPQAATPPGVTPPEVVTSPPELVGFGAFYTLINNGTPVTDDRAHPVTLTGTAVSPASAGKLLPDTLVLQMNAVTGVYPPPTAVQLTRQEDGTYTRISNLEFTKLTLIASPDAPTNAPAPVSFYQLISYISDGNTESNATVQGVGHSGVIGYTTSITDIAALRLGNVVATYNGHSLVNQQASLAPMTMTVNFGQSSWTGIWNNGADANGAIGFSASGSISGAQFNSTTGSITALDSNNISGSVRGAFYGTQAAAVGGIADITKNNVHHVDPFIAFKQPTPSTTPTPSPPSGAGSQ